MHDFRHTAGCGQEWNDCGIGCVSCDLYGDAIGRRRQIPEKEVMPGCRWGEQSSQPGRGDVMRRLRLLRIESDGAGCYGSKVKLAICLKTRLRLSRFGDKPAALRGMRSASAPPVHTPYVGLGFATSTSTIPIRASTSLIVPLILAIAIATLYSIRSTSLFNGTPNDLKRVYHQALSRPSVELNTLRNTASFSYRNRLASSSGV